MVPMGHPEAAVNGAARVHDAALRAEAYRLIGVLLAYPQREQLDEERRELIPELAPRFADVFALIDDDVEGEHVRLFARSAPVSPYETAYSAADKGTTLGQLAALYEMFGLRVGGAEREAPDHVGAEVEFASLLSLKEALCAQRGDLDNLAVTVAARRTFLEEHLGRWAGAFARQLAETTDHPFHRAVGEALRELVAEDLREHGWAAAPSARRGLPVVDDAMVCPTAGGEEG